MDKHGFAARLRAFRESRGLQQKDLGDLAGIPANNISNWELAYSYPSIPSLIKLAVALGCSVDNLLGAPGSGITGDELAFLSKYRQLDEAGKDTVRAVLDSQLRRIGSDG